MELTGAAANDRQVHGLGTPSQGDAAASADVDRRGLLTTTTTTGTLVLTGALEPAPSSLQAGLLITVIPQETNVSGASLALNGNAAYPIVKWGGVPVDSADLVVGVPNRLLFDGIRFQLINWNARPCPAGSFPGSAMFCVDDSVRQTGTFYEAVSSCEARGGRLCSFGEWASVCRRVPTFINTVTAYEWVEDAHNNDNDNKVMGAGYNGPDVQEGIACEYGFSRTPQSVHNFRCCFDR
ncbi:MAG: hypothetical protein ACO1NQ_09680 [Flavobacteriales bacterium]